jgi:4'-phosphopantetheinyl transferase EntD
MAEALAAILPAGAVCVERGSIGERGPADTEPPGLYPGEEALVADASEGRRREFAEGRDCARAALRALGAPLGAILAGSDGAPLWPDGIVGSITHKGGYRAAAVARASDLAGLGIDAEPDARLPEGVLETVASPRELDEVEILLAGRPGIAWDRLLFTAKESALKAASPLGLSPAGVRGVEVGIDAGAATHTAVLAGAGERRPALQGRWASRDGLLVAVTFARGSLS